MDKHWIISEIRRTASENDGVPLGVKKFQKITGISTNRFLGKYWRTWAEALNEAGFSENKFNTGRDIDFLLVCLAKLTRTLRRFPAAVDIKLARRDDSAFPSVDSFDRRLGTQSRKIGLIKKYVTEHEEYADILELLPQGKNAGDTFDQYPDTNVKTKDGFVYLGMLKIDTKKRYKIGKTNFVERRHSELSFQLPEKLELVHYIRTDDMTGIESYWHKRFADKNTNGEWFDLSSDEVRAFKLRKFM